MEEKFRWILIFIAKKLLFLTLVRPHEEVRGCQTKLHPGFTMGKLVQPSPSISILRDSHIVQSNRS